MALYRFTLRLIAPLGTPIVGPTLFGQICWQIVEEAGEDALCAWLANPDQRYRLSDGFPANFLPRPLVHPRPIPANAFDRLKEIKKRTLVRRDAWLQLRDAWRDAELEPQDTFKEPRLSRRVAHNHAHRGGQGTLEEGGLYFLEEDWRFANEHCDIDLYVETSEPLAEVRRRLEALGQRGYGRDAGTGRGRWQVLWGEQDDLLATHPGPRRMSLSRGVLDLENMQDALWKLEPHLGRVGPELSLRGISPFKYPVLLTKPGLTFTPKGPGPWGRLLTGVHPTRPEIVLMAEHIAIPFNEASEEARA